EFAHENPVGPDDRWMGTHVVNTAMGVKAPAVRFRRTGDAGDRAAAATALDTLDAFHGQAGGRFSGDEHLAGHDPTRGTELCAVVEEMYSLETLVATLGEVRFADRLEALAFNALPAAFTADMSAHQYDQQANQVLSNVAERPWSNGPDANTFGLEPNYGCCTANLHQGWPKLATRAWMRADDGLAATSYVPTAVTADVGGQEVRVVVETDYPFADTVALRVETAAPAAFALHLRIPGWCESADLDLPGETRAPDGGQFHRVEREWADGDTVTLDLGAPLEAERRYRGAVALARGPLVFSLPVAAEFQQYGGEAPFEDWELYPAEQWAYGLAVDTDSPAGELVRRAPGEVPFSPDAPPVELEVEGAPVEGWGLAGNDAGPVPASPTAGGERESLTLVPYGCTNLRVTEFPLL
ncbi:MAG: beta-L-arabinofuranosidase domain-containing protein, partial [Halobacteriaceae archaeon]